MTTFALPVSAKANVRSTLRAQPGRSQNPCLAISSQANSRSKLSAQRGRRQNRLWQTVGAKCEGGCHV
jgi:hypothetical protein